MPTVSARARTHARTHATAQDHTIMFHDVNVVVQCINDILVPRQFLIHAINDYLRVINEVGDEHITTIRGLLKHVDVGQRVRFLYLGGHGIPGSVASALAESPANDETNKSKVWHRWDLRWCLETMGKKPSEITKGAQKGDIVVFSSGFLTPEWVVDRIEESEAHKICNTVIIVVDACFSGCW